MYSAALRSASFCCLLAVASSVRASGDDVKVTVREVGGCSNALAWDKANEIRSSTRDGKDLVVSVLSNATCGGLRAELPLAEVVSNSVKLSWKWVNPNDAPLAACLCTRHLEFRLSGLSDSAIVVSAAARQ
jgi:hypothetical protein